MGRIEALELALDTILKKDSRGQDLGRVPKVILERRPVYVKISEDELHGRIILLGLEGFLDEWRTAGEIASELYKSQPNN